MGGWERTSTEEVEVKKQGEVFKAGDVLVILTKLSKTKHKNDVFFTARSFHYPHALAFVHGLHLPSPAPRDAVNLDTFP